MYYNSLETDHSVTNRRHSLHLCQNPNEVIGSAFSTANMTDYNSTARALALPIDEPEPRSHSNSPVFSRRSTSVPRHRRGQSGGVIAQAAKLQRNAAKTFFGLSPAKRVLLVIAGVAAFVLGILFLVYNERIFHAMAPIAKRWRGITGGWLILWAATFFVSFPPLIGYSSCVTLAGFVYGVPKG